MNEIQFNKDKVKNNYHLFDLLFRKSQIQKKEIKLLNELFEWFICTVLYFGIALIAALSKDATKFGDEFRNFISEYGLVFSLFIFGLKIFYNIVRNLEHNVDTKLNKEVNRINNKVVSISEIVDGHLKKAKIIFESGIKDFDDDHLLVLQKILNNIEDLDVKNIYCIDNSDPIQWWSETMTGYLALLSKWKSGDKNRNVHRIFVFTKNELSSPIVSKTITLHSLMGFKTYIYSKRHFDEIYDSYCKPLEEKKVKKIDKRECLIWDNPATNTVKFNINNRDWDQVTCYQSFWSIDTQKDERKNNMDNKKFMWNNYHNQPIIKSEDVKIWFEFIPLNSLKKHNDNWIELPNQYIGLINELISKTVCCKDANDIRLNTSKNYGIEIKTISCESCTKQSCHNKMRVSNGTKFEFVSSENIKKLLENYRNQ